MVDLVVLQSVSYIVAAIGVLVAAFYYALTLRETSRNRRVTLTTNLMQSFFSEEGNRRFVDLMNMAWKDFDDFVKRYDSHVNPDSFTKRMTFWNACEILGYQYKSGLIDIETLYTVCGNWIILGWMKFKPIIDEYRKFDYSKDTFENFEYLAFELSKIKAQRDPSYKGSASYFKPEEYEKTFTK